MSEMKVVLLAGGFGTRLSEETHLRPKPMVEIGGKPILWHIMKHYSAYGFHDFIICCGYKGYLIKEYFANYFLHMSDVTFDMKSNQMAVHQRKVEPWTVTLVDTGMETMTGGRLKRIRQYLNEQPFCMTYGDGLSDVPLDKLTAFHRSHKKKATLTAVQPPGKFGALNIDGSSVTSFREKPLGDNSWVNGGFFILDPSVLDYIENDNTSWEQEPLITLAQKNELAAYKHEGFWKPMDTLRDHRQLEDLWNSGQAPWKIW